MMKYVGTELNKDRHELTMAAGGFPRAGMGQRGVEQRRNAARLAAHQGETALRAGTSEVMLGINRQTHSAIAGGLRDERAKDETDDPDRGSSHVARYRRRILSPTPRRWRICGGCGIRGTPMALPGDLWRQFGEMGFNGVLASEDDGGMGLGHVEAGILLEQMGRNLTPSPFLSSAVGAVTALSGTMAGGEYVARHRGGRKNSPRWRLMRAHATGPNGSRCAPHGRAMGSLFRAKRAL